MVEAKNKEIGGMNMKKRCLSVVMFASIFFSGAIFASEVEKNATDNQKEPVNYESKDLLEVQAREFSIEEILNAYFGESKWNINALTQQSYGKKGQDWYAEAEYSNENIEINCICDDFGFFNFEVQYKKKPELNDMMHEWISMIDRLGISIDDQYEKRTDEIDDGVQYGYRIKQNDLVVGDEIIIIGSGGNETDYPAPMLTVTLTDKGYNVLANFIADIVQKNEVDDRQLQTEEMAKENFIGYMKELYSETWDEFELQEDTFEAQMVYIPVDQGKEKYSYLYDLAYEVKLKALYGEETPMDLSGYVDAQYPYCYYGNVVNEDDQSFQIEYGSLNEETEKK